MTRLSAQEDVIEFCRRKSFKTYIIISNPFIYGARKNEQPAAVTEGRNVHFLFQVIVILWIIALSIFAPVIWVRQVETIDIGEPNMNLPGYCIEKWPENDERLVYGVLCFVFVYAVPGSVVVLAYSLMGFRLCAISPPFDGPGNEGMANTRQVNHSTYALYFAVSGCKK
jgi:hypothetical protein